MEKLSLGGALELGTSSKKGFTVELKLDGKSTVVVEASNGLEVVTTGLDGGATGSRKLPCCLACSFSSAVLSTIWFSRLKMLSVVVAGITGKSLILGATVLVGVLVKAFCL